MSWRKKICPVPFEQQPLNEYLSLKKNWLFQWSTYDNRRYIMIYFFIFIVSFFINGFFIFYLYYDKIKLLKIFFLDIWIASTILFVIFLRLYLGWSYINKRLLSATVFYEESGWYDGQIWVKNIEILMQDRLIGLYQLIPLINRIKYSLGIFIINIFLSSLLYYCI